MFTFISCTKSKESATANATFQPDPAVTTRTIQQSGGTISNNTIIVEATAMKPRDERQGTSFQLQNVKPEVLAKSNSISNPYNSQFFPIKAYARLVPIDFKIGELLDYDSLTRDERLIFATLTDFMASLLKGEIKKETIEETEYLRIFRLVSPSLAESIPVDYRIGKLSISSQDDASVPLRVYGERGSTYGSIYFVKKDATWVISDVQIDLSEYESPRGNEKFMPSAYNNWMY